MLRLYQKCASKVQFMCDQQKSYVFAGREDDDNLKETEVRIPALITSLGIK